jgi:hypothetical protein
MMLGGFASGITFKDKITVLFATLYKIIPEAFRLPWQWIPFPVMTDYNGQKNTVFVLDFYHVAALKSNAPLSLSRQDGL